MEEIPEEAKFYKHANTAYQDWAVEKGFFDAPQPVTFQLWLEPLAKFQLAAEGKGAHKAPDHVKERIKAHFTPLPAWYAPYEGAALCQRQRQIILIMRLRSGQLPCIILGVRRMRGCANPYP